MLMQVQRNTDAGFRDVNTGSVRCWCRFNRDGDAGSILFAIGSRV